VDGANKTLRVLEIGGGSGVISNFFSELNAPKFDVHMVDLVDQRTVTSGYEFHLVRGCELPFAAGMFDVIISNHVLEHVGDGRAQRLHLDEISRVMAPDGIAYMATPSRWQIVEPHFNVPFLSWAPQFCRSTLLSAWKRRRLAYDCKPLGRREISRLIDDACLQRTDIVLDAFRFALKSEPTSIVSRLAGLLPDWLLGTLRWATPTHVFLLRHARSRGSLREEEGPLGDGNALRQSASEWRA
jgi:SAM-dependent methyltransferase